MVAAAHLPAAPGVPASTRAPRRRRLVAALCLAVGLAGTHAGLAASAPASKPAPLIRDQRELTIDGVPELWRLEWTSPPQPSCEAGSPYWYTCPCAGFSFGERGQLDLVRLRAGREIERMPLAPLFASDDDAEGAEVVLRRVEPTHAETDGDLEDEQLADRVRARPSEPVLELADYDHDGRATEFLLQVESESCGKRIMVAIGVSRGEPELHVFHTEEHPEEPLYLRSDHWQTLRDEVSPVREVDWPCGDHASPIETELELSATRGGISVHERVYGCGDLDERQELMDESDR
ncbi:MAG TPA: hypothetical protein VGV61_12010 [Thermoanaerobaculia bacterium]|jgi:hypothetical protein|nr:hypothetical protein [Thermoanaerobaculia bacterium]